MPQAMPEKESVSFVFIPFLIQPYPEWCSSYKGEFGSCGGSKGDVWIFLWFIGGSCCFIFKVDIVTVGLTA